MRLSDPRNTSERRAASAKERRVAARKERHAWKARGEVIREAEGPGRAETRGALRDPRKRIEYLGRADDPQSSAFTTTPLGTRRKRRRAENRAARGARRRNR